MGFHAVKSAFLKSDNFISVFAVFFAAWEAAFSSVGGEALRPFASMDLFAIDAFKSCLNPESVPKGNSFLNFSKDLKEVPCNLSGGRRTRSQFLTICKSAKCSGI